MTAATLTRPSRAADRREWETRPDVVFVRVRSDEAPDVARVVGWARLVSGGKWEVRLPADGGKTWVTAASCQYDAKYQLAVLTRGVSA